MIPLVLKVQIKSAGQKERNIWLPIFVIWLLLIWLFVSFWSLFSALLLFTMFVLILTGKTAVSLNTTMRVAELISAIAGTSIHVGSSEQCVRIEIL